MMGAKSFRARKGLRRSDPPFDDGGDVSANVTSLDDGGDASSGALQIIDRALRDVASRRTVSSAEVVDLLLDLRSAIVLDAMLRELGDGVEVH